MSEPPQKKTKLEEETSQAHIGISAEEVAKLLNPAYLSDEHIDVIKEHYKSHTPFNYAVLPKFMDETLLKAAAAELEADEWFPKNNDLYTFLQTDDLKITKKVRAYT